MLTLELGSIQDVTIAGKLLPTSNVLVTTPFYIRLLAIILLLFQLVLHNQTSQMYCLREVRHVWGTGQEFSHS